MNRWDTIVKPIAGAAEIQDHRAPSLNLGRVDIDERTRNGQSRCQDGTSPHRVMDACRP
jgi:hypothetical protein